MTQVAISAADPAQTGCVQGPAGYACTFTVDIQFSGAQSGSTIDTAVTASAAVPGAPPEMDTATFGSTVAPGSGSVQKQISVFFTFDPCLEDSTATAATRNPNAATSPAVAFGRICVPPYPTPSPSPTPTPAQLTVTQVTLAAAPPSAGGCSQNPAGYSCGFLVAVKYQDAEPNSSIVGSVTATLSPPGSPAESRTVTFALHPDPGTGAQTVSVSVLFTNLPCVEDATAIAVIQQPTPIMSSPVSFGRICTPG